MLKTIQEENIPLGQRRKKKNKQNEVCFIQFLELRTFESLQGLFQK